MEFGEGVLAASPAEGNLPFRVSLPFVVAERGGGKQRAHEGIAGSDGLGETDSFCFGTGKVTRNSAVVVEELEALLRHHGPEVAEGVFRAADAEFLQ